VGGGVEVWEVAQTMYTYVSKCKNNKIKNKKKGNLLPLSLNLGRSPVLIDRRW
jgi:hypothetical protein